MKEFLEQLGFEDITSDNFFMKYSLNEYFDWDDKYFNALYRRINDNGIITYIMHGTNGYIDCIGIISKYGHKWQKSYQFVPNEYIKEVIFKLLISVEAKVLRL